MSSLEREYEGLPFEILSSDKNSQIRKFKSTEKIDESDWHRDKEDREVVLLSGSGWLIQFDNKIPEALEPGKAYKIPAGVWHRILRTRESTDIEVKVSFCV